MDDQERNAPLVVFTVLGPASVGLLLGALVIGGGVGGGNGDVDAGVVGGAYGAAAATAAFLLAAGAVIASLAHLDKPFRAYRALRRFPASPLSREIAAFAAYGVAAAAYAVATLTGARPLWLGVLSVALGAVAVAATAWVYVIPGRPAWRHWSTPAGFAGCALALGPALALALAGAWGAGALDGSRPALLRSVMVCGVALAAVAFWARAVSWRRVFGAAGSEGGPTGVWSGAGLWVVRVAVGLVLPLPLVLAAPTAPLVAAAGALALLLGETADRTLFFGGTAPHPIGLEIPGAR